MSESIPENPSPNTAAPEPKAAWAKAKPTEDAPSSAASAAGAGASARSAGSSAASAAAGAPVAVGASWPTLGETKKAEPKPRSTSPRKKSEEEHKEPKEPKEHKESKGKGKWVPFPEPVPVAPREESHDGHHHPRGDSARRGGGGRGRGGRGGRGGMGGRGSHHGSSSHYHRSHGPSHPSNGPASAANGAPASDSREGQAVSGQSLNFDAPSFQPYSYPAGYPDYSYFYETLYHVQKQIEYYFSEENLAKDAFLRSQLNAEGWVPIEIIANFRRLASMLVGMIPPENFNFIVMAIQNSAIVEFNNGLIRRRQPSQLSSDAPAFVPSSATSAAASAPASDPAPTTAAAAPASSSASTLAPASAATAPSKASPATARSPAVTGTTVRSRASSAPRSPVLRPKEEGEWTEVAPAKRTQAKAGKARKQSQSEEPGDDEMEFMFDEEAPIATRPGGKAPLKHTVNLEDADSDVDDEDEEELPDEEFENIVVIVQTPDSRGKKAEPRDRTGMPTLKARSEFAGHIQDELGDYNDGIEYKARSGSFSKTSVVNRAEFEAQRAASGMSPTALLQQSPPKLPSALGSSPLSGISKTPSKAIPMGRSPSNGSRSPAPGSLARSPASGIAGDGQKKFFPTPVKEPAAKKTPYKSKYGSNPVAESGVGWIKMRHPRASPAPINLGSSLDPASGTPKARQIATDLISSQGLVEQKYRRFLNECLADREAKGAGKSDLMSALFRFWSFFLRNNFNRSVYEEFKKLARADSAAGFSYGMECLYRFYSYGLEKSFRRGPFEDFQQFVIEDFKMGNLYGLEKFWAFLKYRKDKRPVKYTDELDAILKNFNNLDDFHTFGSRACNPAPAAAAAAAEASEK